MNDSNNAAIAYDKFTQDQKLMGNANNCVNLILFIKIYFYVRFFFIKKGSDLSQAYAYLANYYFKKRRLDNAYEAATKSLEFAEV